MKMRKPLWRTIFGWRRLYGSVVNAPHRWGTIPAFERRMYRPLIGPQWKKTDLNRRAGWIVWERPPKQNRPRGYDTSSSGGGGYL